ncbi:MAG: hypothetical protein ABWY93_18600 [Mycobacterium sp.]
MRRKPETITLSGPNLRLMDLRWLVERCADLDPASAVEIVARTGHGDPFEIDYEKIVIRPG